MKNKALYLVVRLDIYYQESTDWEDVKEKVINECNYSFEFKRTVNDHPDNPTMIKIIDTQICGESVDL